MINILLAGVGGQGTVLAAKVLAQAAQEKGWQVRTAETIGMSQRGGSVTSHVRMGDGGEEVFAPLIANGCAQMIIAFEPAEAARSLQFLAPGGIIVCAKSAMQPVTVALSGSAYHPEVLLDALRDQLVDGRRLVVVDDVELVQELGNRKALNTLLLACAIKAGEGVLPLSLDDLRAAITACVKERFVPLNLRAIDIVEAK